MNPLWFKYPHDANTFNIDLQFFYGDSILVSPVTVENATSVDAYFPDDLFYNFNTLELVRGRGANVTLTGIDLTDIPVHIRGGTVLPLRVESAMTTTALRKKNFELVVAPGLDGTASGRLYVDDGVSISQASGSITEVTMKFGNGELIVGGTFGRFTGDLVVERVSILGVQSKPKGVTLGGESVEKSRLEYDGQRKVLNVSVGVKMNKGFAVTFL